MKAMFVPAAMLLVSWTCAATAPPPARFGAAPKLSKDGDGVKIAFAVAAPTDVEVAVVVATNRVVRHLAAGVLGGENPPPAPLRPGLAQELIWDGKDDDGAPVDSPVRVRVRAGMRPVFDRFLLFNPHGSAGIPTLAVGPKGQLYVFHKHATANGNSGSYSIKIYDREGRHVRALAPFPADIAPARLAALGVFQDADGRLVPRVQNWERLSFYPDPEGNRGIALGGGMPAVDSRGRVYWLSTAPVLLAIDPDGGVPYEQMFTRPLLKDYPRLGANRAILAVSSDDRHVYLSGLTDQTNALPCVFRVDTATRAPGEPFLGRLGQSGTEGALLTSPQGLAVANGLVYVADRAANRVAVFQEQDGTSVGQLAVPAPDTIGVDPASGAVYVCSLVTNPPVLVKFDNFRSGRELYRMTLPKAIGKHRIAVDAGAKPVRIWMPAMHYGPNFTCIEDTGEGFRNLGDPRPKPAEVTAEGMRDLTVDRWRGEFYVKCSGERWFRIDDRTGDVLAEIKFKGYHMGNHATQLVPCRDGSLVTLMWSDNWMKRWTRDGAPLNWEGSDSNRATGTEKGIMTYTQKYLAFHNGELYQVMRIGDRKYSSVNVYGMDGKPRRTVIWQCSVDAVPRLDPRGNIFLGANIRPPGRAWPEFFDDKLGPVPDKIGGFRYWYSYLYGSVVKFPPSGGAVWMDEQAATTAIGQPSAEFAARPRTPASRHRDGNPKQKLELQGAEWLRFGFAPAHQYQSVGGPTCMCEGAGYDVDAYGRVFYPNLPRFRVEMADNNNNPIGTFGEYGNEDSLGGGRVAEGAWREGRTRIAHPDIPLAWPTYVAVSDRHAYVNDLLSRRVVRVKLAWQAEEILPVE